jgi:two-component system, LuxR family, sensor kinase FixL
MRTPRGRFFTGFIRDLTERQATEARLFELQSELTHISRLSEMGEMAAALAHELNQPLSAIAKYLRGSQRLIDRGDADMAMIGSALDKAADQALRAGDIIRRLRDFVSRGDIERGIERVSKLVDEASALALIGAKEHGIGIIYRLWNRDHWRGGGRSRRGRRGSHPDCRATPALRASASPAR